jgi:hypothetical protein
MNPPPAIPFPCFLLATPPFVNDDDTEHAPANGMTNFVGVPSYGTACLLLFSTEARASEYGQTQLVKSPLWKIISIKNDVELSDLVKEIKAVKRHEFPAVLDLLSADGEILFSFDELTCDS